MIKIAPTLSFPIEVVTETLAILAIKGAGKTNTAAVLVEGLIAARQPVVIIDPTSAWFGLRVSRDGKGAGLPVTILGGEHGDVPLADDAGVAVADLVVTHPGPYVLDLSDMSTGEMHRFTTAFADRFYLLKNRARYPQHLVIDEADEFAPQRPMHGAERCLGAIDRIVRRGRNRGIGVTLCSQRPAVLNKNVLSQCSTLIALRASGAHDLKAISDWMEANTTPEQRTTMLRALPSLAIGEAFVWSPGWLRILERVQIRLRATFDSGKTPRAGDAAASPEAFAPVSVADVKRALADVVARAEADDPKALRRRIAELEAREGAGDNPDAIAERDEEIETLKATIADLNDTIQHSAEEAARVRERVETVVQGATALLAEIQLQSQTPSSLPTPSRIVSVAPRPIPTRVRQPPGGSEREAAANGKLSRCARSMLVVLAQRGKARVATTAAQLAILSRYSLRSSTFANALSELRMAGYASGGRESLRIEPLGVRHAGHTAPYPTGTALLHYWCEQLSRAERTMLEELYRAHPRSIARETLGTRTGYSTASSTFANALSKLRVLQLASGSGEIKIAPVFFE